MVPSPPADPFLLPLVMTQADVARVLRRSERWIRRQVAAGTFPIPAIQFDEPRRRHQKRRRLYRRADVLQFIGETKRPAPAGLAPLPKRRRA